MRTALSLGQRGLGRVWPNPAVGCILVKAGQVVGRGWTADGGRPHAEVVALAEAGALAKGATAYVTLEPCAHIGETGPCSEALIAAGVARVVVATTDPDPRVSGKGIEMLRTAGVDVAVGVCKGAANRDHAGFFARVSMGRPFVTLKLAGSVDGRITTRTGESQWITGPEARHVVHAMRARHDAVMVGAGTARADDPSLNVRGMADVPQPVRVVVSQNLNIPTDGTIARTANEQPVWVLHQSGAATSVWEGLGARCFDCDAPMDLTKGLEALAEAGLTRVFCEGGGGLAASLLRAGLVDELVVFTAGLGIGADGMSSLASLGVEALSDAPRFALEDVRSVGPDTMTVWRR